LGWAALWLEGRVVYLAHAGGQKHHYQELDARLKAELGETSDSYLEYFTTRCAIAACQHHYMITTIACHISLLTLTIS